MATLTTLSTAVITGATASNTTQPPEKPLSSSFSPPPSSTAYSSQTHKPISSNPNNLTISTSGSPLTVVSSCCDDFDWVSVDKSEGDFITDHVPLDDELQDAFSALQQVLDVNLSKNAEDGILSPMGMTRSVSSSGSELDWMEPPVNLFTARMLQPYLFDRFYDAFHLLQTEPSVQRMVISLSSDRAVWDAVMNNEVVREIITKVEDNAESTDEKTEGSSSLIDHISLVFESGKAKVMDVIEKITRYVTELFKLPNGKTTAVAAAGSVVEKLQMTVLLSIIVLLIVVVTRARKA